MCLASRQTGMTILFSMLTTLIIPTLSFANAPVRDTRNTNPVVIQNMLEKAQANNDWKLAIVTGKYAQVLLRSISLYSNPKNETGMQALVFDQIIMVVEGQGKVVLNDKTSTINEYDMVFIPEGTRHNIINTDTDNPLRLITFYSGNDILANEILKKNTSIPN